jgi:dienelactone hydrolase
MSAAIEQTLVLGPRKSMVAVISPAAPLSSDHPTALILNSGIVHRVGANRMSVMLARTLAAAGTTAVRFDLSGIGDSDSRTDGLAPIDGALADIKEALDSLESTRQIRCVILIGLCSGADFSQIYSGSDPRVVGAVLIDPSIPHSFRHWFHHYRRRATRLDSWRSLARGHNPVMQKLIKRVAQAWSPPVRTTPTDDPPPPPSIEDPEVRAYLEAAYRRALANGVQFLAISSGERSTYREHLLHAFPDVPFGDRLRLEYFKDADHVFTHPADRDRLIRLIVEWTQHTRFRSARPDAGAVYSQQEKAR